MPQTVDWYQSVAQAKAQFTMWALMSAPLLIAADPGQVEPELLSYWGNEEILEVSQTFREGGPYQAARLVGDDGFYFDPKTSTGGGSQVWGKLLPAGSPDSAPGFALGFVSNEDAATTVTCDEACFDALFAPPPPPTCAAAQFAPLGDVQCTGLSWRSAFSLEGCCAWCSADGNGCETYQWCADNATCATGGGASDGPKTPGCYVGKMMSGACANSTAGWQSMKRTGRAPEPPAPVRPASLAVRDLWAHEPLPTLTPPFSFNVTLEPHGGVAIYRFSPPADAGDTTPSEE